MDKTRIYNRWPVAREGIPFAAIIGCLTLLLWGLGYRLPSVVAGILCLFVVYFFRDPERRNNGHPKAVLSPADGKVLRIEQIEADNSPLKETTTKISVFMSIFDVHVNRIPVGGVIERVTYHSGKFFSANLDKASDQNERNRIILKTDHSHSIAIVQVAGLIARRIVCWVAEGDHVESGQRFGLIRFGSRLEIHLPSGCRISVHAGQKVRAGQSVVGYLP